MSRGALPNRNDVPPGDAVAPPGGGPPSTAPHSETDASVAPLSQRSEDFGLGAGPHGSQRDSPGDDPLIGVDLGGIRIERLIGTGGMGRVYAARQMHPDRVVAVKVMQGAAYGTEAAQRFRREADTLARLRHPGIAQIFTAGCHRCGIVDVPYYAMEHVPEALSLVQACDRRAIPPRGRLQLLLEVCEAVGHGHAHGVVHRDLKPGNILVGADGHAKIIDFGVAKLVGEEVAGGPHTETGQFLGTRPYMAPEQFGERRAVIDARTDVYALGLVMHELLGGRLPYDVAGRSLVETARIVQETPPARLVIAGLQDADRGLAGGAAAIVAKCLRKSPAARYRSAAGVAADLRRLLAGEPPAAAAEAGLPGGVGRFVSWCRRWSAALVAVAGLGAAAVAVRSRPTVSGTRPADTPAAVMVPAAGDDVVPATGRTQPPGPSSREIRFDLLDDEWDRYVVEIQDVERYTERYAGSTTFIRPTVAGREGVITLRFDMPFTIQDAMLKAPLEVWTTGDPFPYDPGARAALDVSPDGETWTNLVDLKAGAGGSNTTPHEIGRVVAGGTRIWVRVRLTATRKWPRDGLIFAQFLRIDPKEPGTGFLLTATGRHPPANSLESP